MVGYGMSQGTAAVVEGTGQVTFLGRQKGLALGMVVVPSNRRRAVQQAQGTGVQVCPRGRQGPQNKAAEPTYR